MEYICSDYFPGSEGYVMMDNLFFRFAFAETQDI